MTRRTQIAFKLALTCAGFLCLTILAALLLRAVFSDGSPDRGPASVGHQVFVLGAELKAPELAMLDTKPLVRGNRASFREDEFRRQASVPGNQVTLNLFPDLGVTVELKPSSFDVNENIFVGQVLNDPASQVRIMVQDGAVSGAIESNGHTYKIQSAGSGQAIITEVRP